MNSQRGYQLQSLEYSYIVSNCYTEMRNRPNNRKFPIYGSYHIFHNNFVFFFFILVFIRRSKQYLSAVGHRPFHFAHCRRPYCDCEMQNSNYISALLFLECVSKCMLDSLLCSFIFIYFLATSSSFTLMCVLM